MAAQAGTQKRYVQLHRMVEGGQADDAVWQELCAVCCHLGYMQEAVRGLGHISDSQTRQKMEMWLAKNGAMNEAPAGEKPVESSARQAPVQTERSSLSEEISDSFRYLFLDHLPYAVMAVTLMFPLVVGLGGALTAGTGVWVFPAIALLPVLCIGIAVGSLAYQVLIESCHGVSDPPRIARYPEVVNHAIAVARALAVCTLALLVPGAVLTWFFAAYGLILLVPGTLLFPLAVALCLTREDLRGVHPKVLLPTAKRVGGWLLGASSMIWLLFVPAAFAAYISSDTAVFLRLSFIGPLSIVPLLIGARLMGCVLYLSRGSIEELLWTKPNQLDAARDSTVEVYSSGRFDAVGAAALRASGTAPARPGGAPARQSAGKRPSPVTASGKRRAAGAAPQATAQAHPAQEDPRASGKRRAAAPDPRDSGQHRAVQADPRGSGRHRAVQADPRGSGPHRAVQADPRGSGQHRAVQADPKASARQQAAKADPRASARRRAAPADPRASAARPAAPAKGASRSSGTKGSGITVTPVDGAEPEPFADFEGLPGFKVLHGDERVDAGAAARLDIE